MNEPMGGRRPEPGPGRNLISILGFGVLLAVSSPAYAGGIRHHHLAEVRTQARVRAAAADPWGAYWQDALNHHRMHVNGPKALSILSLSADGTLPASPFVEYLQWRQGLHAKVFDSFHPDIAKVLKRVSHAPSLVPPSVPGGPVPIQPPDFTPLGPLISPQSLNPPQVPEPATGLLALGMIAAAVVARRKIGDRARPDTHSSL